MGNFSLTPSLCLIYHSIIHILLGEIMLPIDSRDISDRLTVRDKYHVTNLPII